MILVIICTSVKLELWVLSGFSIDEAREPYKLGPVPTLSKTAQLIGFRASGASRLVPFHGGTGEMKLTSILLVL